MLRRTKIVATLGPATSSPTIIDQLLRAGLDVVRINLSHGASEDHLRQVSLVRERGAVFGREVGVLVDLQGPKIRVERFREGKVTLREGQSFTLNAECPADDGDIHGVGVTYKNLSSDVGCGDTLLLDDGFIELSVTEVRGPEVICCVKVGGRLSNGKGINRQGGGLSAPALTDKDRSDIRHCAELEADYMALSFVRRASDIHDARALLHDSGGRAAIVAKIERAEAMDVLDEIITAADGVMVARGDLGVEIGDAQLPPAQKKIIAMTRARNRVVITATQMLQSMVDSPLPTRAEVFDVAHAVADGTDAVMLSAETAIGRNPIKAVAAMNRICREAEKQPSARRSRHRLDERFDRIDEAIAMSTMYAANHLHATAIISLTESGSTALWMSRISSGIPIYALTRHERTRRKAMLVRGVYPIAFDPTTTNPLVVIREAIETLYKRALLRDEDLVIITKGDMSGVVGGTNLMKVVRVGQVLSQTED
jgi:pyruvate kinase